MSNRAHSSTRARRTARAAGAARRRTEAAAPATGEYSSPACYLHELGPGEPQAAGVGVYIKRIYDAPDTADGYRALVDRLWPRGISRERAALNAWLKELAPSAKLRIWFGHDPKRWTEFGRRYRAELRAQRPLLESLRLRAQRARVTLLYGSREPRINHAVVLREVLLKNARSRRPSAQP